MCLGLTSSAKTPLHLLSLDVAAEEVLQDMFRLFGDIWEYHHHGQYPFDPSLPCQMNQLVFVRPQLVIQPRLCESIARDPTSRKNTDNLKVDE